MLSKAEEFLLFAGSFFSLAPQYANTAAYADLCQRYLDKDQTAARELLAASLLILAGQAKHYDSPGLVVSDFWVVIEQGHQTPRDVRCAMATLRRNRFEKDSRRITRDTIYQQVELGESAPAGEGLSAKWFHSLDADDQQLLLLVGLEELTNAQIAERLGLGAEAVKKRRQRLLAELKDFLSPSSGGTGHLSSEPRATPKPSARGSKKTQ